MPFQTPAPVAAQTDTRSLLSAAFRQSRKLLGTLLVFFLFGLTYIMLADKAYQSSAKLLVKFGQDARPEASEARDAPLSADEKRGLVASNINILTSRDVLAQLLNDTTIARVYPKLAQTPPQKMPLEEAALKRLSGDIVVKNEADAGVLTVSLYNSDPQLAASMLQHLIDLFLQKQGEIYANPQAAALQSQADEAQMKLGAATKALNGFKDAHGITDLDAELAMLLQQRGDLTGYIARRQSGEGAATGPVSALPIQIPKNGDSARFPVIDSSQKTIDDLRAKESELLQTYRSDSEVVKNIRRQIAAAQVGLNGSVGAIGAQIDRLDRQIADKQELKGALDELQRQADYASEGNKIAQQRLQTAQINKDLNERKITRISVIEQPTVPYSASRPNKPIVLVLSMLVGLALGLAFAVLSEVLDRRFSSPEQLRAAIGLPLLGSFRRVNRQGKGFAPLDAAALSSFYHAFRTVLGDGNSLCLTSAYAGEGVSKLALALAHYATASLGSRVLVIAETTGSPLLPMGRPVATLLDAARDPAQLEQTIMHGGANAGQKAISFAVVARDQQVDISPMQIQSLAPVMAQIGHGFDLVLLCLPGLLTFPAKLPVAALADGTILLVEAERTRAPVVVQVVQMLAQQKARLLGTVLNKQRLYIPRWVYRRL